MSGRLEPGGALATTLPDYEDRPQQRHMAAAVAQALGTGRSLLVEAGTGTGKTFAYLVPAIESGLRVVVSTGTRTLQEQIARRDLPRLEELFGTRITAVTLKGVSNYACQRKLGLARKSSVLSGTSSADLERVLAWAEHSPTGDRAELAGLGDGAAVWAEVTTTADARLGARCPEYERCFVTRARRAAAQADLILVNHHLFFADLALRTAHPGARVLPEFDAVIFDEAHQLEDVITEHMGIAVSTGRVAGWRREAEELLGVGGFALFATDRASTGFADGVRRAAEQFFLVAGRAIDRLAPSPGERVELPPETFSDRAVHEAWLGLDTAVDELAVHLDAMADREDDEQRAEAARGLARRGHRVRDDLAALAEGDSSELVHWGESRAGAVSLRASPIEIDRVVRKELVASTPVVFTSATLSAGGSFAYTRERLGLDEGLADSVALSSPFDYATQALLYAARDLPEPGEAGFAAAAAARIAELLDITGGRAFVLFTSHRLLDDVSRRLAAAVTYPLLIQGQHARAGLLDAFRATDGAVLCATGGFWEGVDVPGDALSQVIIDKLPFAPPSDPLVAARVRRIEERGGDGFARYQLPQAALALKQGFGRLIRRRDDRGLVSVLDSRLVSRRYGRVFTDSLPSALPRTSSIERARRWWAGS